MRHGGQHSRGCHRTDCGGDAEGVRCVFLHVNVVANRGALVVADADVAVVVGVAGGYGGVAAAAATAAATVTATPVVRRQSSPVSRSSWRSCLA